MDQSVVVNGVDGFGRAICRMVIWSVLYHEHIVFEIRLLAQGTLYGILDRADPVADRDHDGCFHLEVTFSQGHLVEDGLQVTAHLFQILRASLLHLYLRCPVAGVYIIEELLPCLPVVKFHLGIEIFVDMHEAHLL